MKIKKIKLRKTIVINGTGELPDNMARKKINEVLAYCEKLEDRIFELEDKLRYIKIHYRPVTSQKQHE